MFTRFAIRGINKINNQKNFSDFMQSETTTQTSKTFGNTIIKSTQFIRSTYDKSNIVVKSIFWTWVIGIPIHNGVATYNAGDSALKQFRSDNNNESDTYKESQVIYKACKSAMYKEMSGSFVWPLTIASQFVPTLVMWNNKPSTNNSPPTNTN